MKAVILAAGKGTRMRELTNELPKPMLSVQNRPILEHIVAGIVAAGVRDIFIVTGFRAEVIEDHFGDGRRWNARIAYGRQLVQDGTGKAPELAREFIGDSPFILAYGDILVKPETYQQMIRRFEEDKFSGVITVTHGEDATRGGLNFFDEQFCLKRLIETPSRERLQEIRRDGWLKPGDPVWFNAGIYIFRPSVFDFMAKLNKSPRGEYELTGAVIAMIAERHTIAGMEIQGRWVDVRDPEVLAALENKVLQTPPQNVQRGNYHSCFISYSKADHEFVLRLYADLQSKGVRCWFAAEDLKIGEELRVTFDEKIYLYEKLIVVLSKDSIRSRWVKKEVEVAMEKEHEEKRRAILPICLDNAVFEIKMGWAADIRRDIYIGDFIKREDEAAYQKALTRLLRALELPTKSVEFGIEGK